MPVCTFARHDVRSEDFMPSEGSRLASLIQGIPLVRRNRGLISGLGERAFDRCVARNLEPVALFQGVTGQCLTSLRRAKALGACAIVDSVTMHIDEFGEALDRECGHLGIRPPVGHRARRRMRKEYQEADAIRVMSDPAKVSFSRCGVDPSKVFVVEPFLEPGDYIDERAVPTVFRVSFVGLVEPWKGIRYLVEAYRSLDLRESELSIWGGSGSRAIRLYLDRAVAGTPSIKVRPIEVRAVGFGEVYGRTSVLVHPSLADGFGLVVAEAMACGVPVITTDRTGASTLIDDGKSGFVVPSGNSSAIAERLEYLYRNPSELHRMGQAARSAARRLTFENFRTQYQSMLASLGVVDFQSQDDSPVEATRG